MIRALLLTALLTSSASGTSVSTFTLSGWSAQAGQSEQFTITRTGIGGQSVTFRTADGSAKAGADYTAVAKTIQFGPYQKSATVQVPTTVDQSALGKTLSFGATITVKGAVVASASAAIVEPPTPAPTPAPTQTDATGPSDTISGLPPIASNFDFNLALQPAWGTGAIPPSSAPDNVGAFRFICGAGQLLYDDPIVYPGQAGASHLHQFYGNTSANANSTYQSLRTSGQSTCANGPYPGNGTPYWAPAMLDGKGHVVQPDTAALYYKRRPLSDPKCSLTSGDPQAEGNCVPIPNGLKMIFGFNMLNPSAPVTGATHWDCSGPGAIGGHYADIPTAVTQGHCGAGDQLLAVQDAPSCWDGDNLDSADHRSHVGYPGYGTWGFLKCDPQHPYVIPSYHLAVAYSIEAGDDLSLWHLSSDEMFPALAHGATLHGDYGPAAWDNNVETMLTQGCIDKMLNCSGGDLGNGKQLIGASQPAYGWTNPNRLVPVP